MHERRSSVQPVALLLTLAAALLRLVPHLPNFAPIGGMALFAGAKLRGWQAYGVPLFAMALTDPILSYMLGYPAFSRATPIIYLSLVLYAVLGRAFLSREAGPLRIASVCLAGSLQFFLVTNLFVWWNSTLYLHSPAGLATCFVAALPFFARTVLSDLVYTVALYLVYAMLAKHNQSSALQRPV